MNGYDLDKLIELRNVSKNTRLLDDYFRELVSYEAKLEVAILEKAKEIEAELDRKCVYRCHWPVHLRAFSASVNPLTSMMFEVHCGRLEKNLEEKSIVFARRFYEQYLASMRE